MRCGIQGAGPRQDGRSPASVSTLPFSPPERRLQGTQANRGGYTPRCAGETFLGPNPPLFFVFGFFFVFCFYAFLFFPVMEPAHSGWASLLGPGCSHEGLSWALVGTQAAYSSLSRVLAPSLTLSVTLSWLWKRNKEPPGPGGAEEFRGQAPAGLPWLVRPGRNTEGLCDPNRHPLSLPEAAPTLARTH